MQAVVSRESNPLPAKVRIKRHEQYGDDFFFVDKSQWKVEKFPFKMYDDPVQAVVQRLIGRSLVMAFSLFEYIETSDKKMYIATLPLPHDACIQKLVQVVRAEEMRCCEEIYQDSKIPNMGDRAQFHADFRNIMDKITRAFIAKQILGTMSTVQVGKNWNSHGADLGFFPLPDLCNSLLIGQCLLGAKKYSSRLTSVDSTREYPDRPQAWPPQHCVRRVHDGCHGTASGKQVVIRIT